MNPICIEVEHFKLIVRTGEKESLGGQAGRRDHRSTRLFDCHQVLRMCLVLENLLKILCLSLQVFVCFDDLLL